MSYQTSAIISEREELFSSMIIEAIEKGVGIWQRGWYKSQIPLPHNPSTGTMYKGINAAMLALKSMLLGYPTLEFMTFNQIKDLNGFVKKDEKAVKVSFFYHFEKKDDEKLSQMSEETRQKYFDEYNKLSNTQKQRLDEEKELFIIRVYPVFNVAQCENIDTIKLAELKDKNKIPTPQEFEKLKFVENPFIEAILKNSGIEIRHGGDRAFYIPRDDFIQLPPRENFKSISEYYSTALHELGHATGHPTRLNRFKENDKNYDKLSYAKEELRAETYSLIQAFDLGLEFDLGNHASYLEHYAQILQHSKDEIKLAVKDAMKINEFVKSKWYPKDKNLTQQRGLDKEKQTQTKNTQSKSQESLNKGNIANKTYSMSR